VSQGAGSLIGTDGAGAGRSHRGGGKPDQDRWGWSGALGVHGRRACVGQAPARAPALGLRLQFGETREGIVA